MNKFIFTILSATALSVGANAENPMAGSVAHAGPDAISLGEVIVGTSDDTGYHLTHGHVQGILEVLASESSVSDINAQESHIRVYPNPVKAILNVDRVTEQKSVLTLFSNSGASVLQTEITELHETIDASSLPLGVYILTISEDSNIVFTTKIIKR